jgi:large subunit ribosomal protein L15
MKLHELKPAEGARRARRRVGRGEGSGRGKTAGRGTKGTRARGSIPLFFEGGQMPLVRRLPKRKGFKPINRVVYGTVNVSELGRVESSEIGPAELRGAGLVRKRDRIIKVLGHGEIDRAVTVKAHAFSATARQKIEGAGGTIEIVARGRSDE